MTMKLNGLGAMAVRLVEAEVGMFVALSAGLEHVAQKIEATAKSEIGTYQPEAGPFPAWPELADSTKQDRLDQGYTENDPLLRSGSFEDSITHRTEGLEAEIGTADERGPWFEFGTVKMPARPVLGPAAFNNKAEIEKLVGAAVVVGLVGADVARGLVAGVIHEGLGYSFKTEE